MIRNLLNKLKEKRTAHQKVKTDLKNGMSYSQAIMNNKMELNKVWHLLK